MKSTIFLVIGPKEARIVEAKKISDVAKEKNIQVEFTHLTDPIHSDVLNHSEAADYVVFVKTKNGSTCHHATEIVTMRNKQKRKPPKIFGVNVMPHPTPGMKPAGLQYISEIPCCSKIFDEQPVLN